MKQPLLEVLQLQINQQPALLCVIAHIHQLLSPVPSSGCIPQAELVFKQSRQRNPRRVLWK